MRRAFPIRRFLVRQLERAILAVINSMLCRRARGMPCRCDECRGYVPQVFIVDISSEHAMRAWRQYVSGSYRLH